MVHRPKIFILLSAHCRSKQNSLFICPLDNLSSRHLRSFHKDLKKSNQEGIIDKISLLIHHLLADVYITNRESMNQRLTFSIDTTGVHSPRTLRKPNYAIIVIKQHRVGCPMSLSKKSSLLGIKCLQCRQYHHGWATTIHLIRSLRVPPY